MTITIPKFQKFDITFTAPPDLKVLDNILAPDAITSGNTIDLSWTVQNQGNGLAAGRWRDSIYLQEVGNPDARLISLTSFTYEGELESGKTYNRQEKIRIPAELQGLYQVVVKTNTGSKDNFLYEANNTDNNQTVDKEIIEITLPPRPDLEVEITEVPDKVSVGGTINVEFDVINQGTAATNVPNWIDRVYLSLDNEISADDLVIDTLDNGSALESGKRYPSTSESIIIPERFRGDAYLIVETDSSNQINELPQEGNNTEFKKITVEFEGSDTGGSGQPSDLVTGDVVAPRQAFEGSTIEVRYKVTNKGSNTNTDRWQDTIWLTRDKNRPSAASKTSNPDEPEDILLKTITHSGSLAVDGEYEEVIEVTIPEKIPGE